MTTKEDILERLKEIRQANQCVKNSRDGDSMHVVFRDMMRVVTLSVDLILDLAEEDIHNPPEPEPAPSPEWNQGDLK